MATGIDSSKVKTLPKDLKKIAEELLADKFPEPEEVKPKKAASFRGAQIPPQYAQEYAKRYAQAADESAIRGGPFGTFGGDVRYETRVDMASRQRRCIAAFHRADTRVIHSLIQKFEQKFCSRDKMVMRVSRPFMNELLGTEGGEYFQHYEEPGYRNRRIGRIFGVVVEILDNPNDPPHIEATF